MRRRNLGKYRKPKELASVPFVTNPVVPLVIVLPHWVWSLCRRELRPDLSCHSPMTPLKVAAAHAVGEGQVLLCVRPSPTRPVRFLVPSKSLCSFCICTKSLLSLLFAKLAQNLPSLAPSSIGLDQPAPQWRAWAGPQQRGHKPASPRPGDLPSGFPVRLLLFRCPRKGDCDSTSRF